MNESSDGARRNYVGEPRWIRSGTKWGRQVDAGSRKVAIDELEHGDGSSLSGIRFGRAMGEIRASVHRLVRLRMARSVTLTPAHMGRGRP